MHLCKKQSCKAAKIQRCKVAKIAGCKDATQRKRGGSHCAWVNMPDSNQNKTRSPVW